MLLYHHSHSSSFLIGFLVESIGFQKTKLSLLRIKFTEISFILYNSGGTIWWKKSCFHSGILTVAAHYPLSTIHHPSIHPCCVVVSTSGQDEDIRIPLRAYGNLSLILFYFCSVDSNDKLYGGDVKFISEVCKIVSTLIQTVFDHLKTLTSNDVSSDES